MYRRIPVTVADLLAVRATLTAWRGGCQAHQDFRFDHSLKRFPSGLLLIDVQARMRCRRCGRRGEVWVRLHSDELLAEQVSSLFTFHNRPFRKRS